MFSNVFGTVKFFNVKQGFGYVVVDSLDREMRIAANNGPIMIIAGDTQPVFTDSFFNHVAAKGDRVVIEVRRKGEFLKPILWGYERFWKKAQTEIATRPTYRVLREDRFKGQVMVKKNREQVIVTGTTVDLKKHPRDGFNESYVDDLAPKYKTGPIVALNRFEIRLPDGTWRKCDDPRPINAEARDKSMRTMKQHGVVAHSFAGLSLAAA